MQKNPHFAALRLIVGLFVISSLPGAAAFGQPKFPDAKDGVFEYEAEKTGLWHHASTWKSGSVPPAGADVLIPATCGSSSPCRVTVKTELSTAIRHIRVEGELRLAIQPNTRLRTETLHVAPGGMFRIGFANIRVNPAYTAHIEFTGSGAIDTTWDPGQKSRGLFSEGAVYLYGSPKTPWLPVDGAARAGDTAISLTDLPNNWNDGDQVVLSGSTFLRTEDETSSQDEVLEITQINGSTLSVSPQLAHDHLPATAGARVHVANLSRNLILSSANPLPTYLRGHVMFANGAVVLDNVAFKDLGRTDKKKPLDDLTVAVFAGEKPVPGKPNPRSFSVTPSTGEVKNPRGRYAVHFHQNLNLDAASPPPQPLSRVYDSVVWGSPGWGFVNHSSFVDFQDNVAYDVDGAGFVTEAGNELGNFFRNLVIRAEGDGDYEPIHRFVFNNAQRPQPLSDFGFRGDGFWFQGPAIRVRDNVAAGCDGAGMVWFTVGAPESGPDLPATHPDDGTAKDKFYVDSDGNKKNKYSFFPRSWIDDVYGAGTEAALDPRHWLFPGETGTDRIVISDLPILDMGLFEGYGNYVGFRLRFVNSVNNSWYEDENTGAQTGFDYNLKIVDDGTLPDYRRQSIGDLLLWNNQQAFRARYVRNTDWNDVTAVNRLAYDQLGLRTEGHNGAELFHNLEDFAFLKPVVIEGYPVAGQVEMGTRSARNEISFVFKDYDRFANEDIWHSGIRCDTPSQLTANPSSTTAALSWTSGSPRHSVRYRQAGSPEWTYLPNGSVSGTSATAVNLEPGTAYEYQVVAGCAKTVATGTTFETLSYWSGVKAFSTN